MRSPSVRSQLVGEGGQGMTEYIIIVALIAIAAIGVYSFFGQTAQQQPPGGVPEQSAKAAPKEPAAAAKAEPKGAADPKNAVVSK